MGEEEQNKSIFRENSVNRLTHPEQLGVLLVVVTPGMWLALFSVFLLVLTFSLWAIFGAIPITLQGRGILMHDLDKQFTINTSSAAVVKEIRVKPGDEVKEGQEIVWIEPLDPNLKPMWVKSEKEGKVLELLAAEGESLRAGGLLAWLQEAEEEKEPLLIYAYFPIEQGKRIELGTAFSVAVSTVDTEEYGLLLGRAIRVSNFATPRMAIAKNLHNKEMAEDLAPGDKAVIEVVVALTQDQAGNYLWTSGKQPKVTLTAGTVCILKAILHKIRPIYYILPIESLKYE